MKKIIREDLATFLQINLIGLMVYLARSHQLLPLIMLLLFLTSVLIFLSTKYNENLVSPILYFNRGFEGILLLTIPFSFFSYFFTWILHEMGELAFYLAEFCVIYTVVLMIFLFFTISTIFGIFIPFIFVFVINPVIIDSFLPYIQGQPFILVPQLIMLFIFAIFGYISHLMVYNGLYSEKDDFEGKKTRYKKIGAINLLIETVVFLLIFVVFQDFFIESIFLLF